MPILDWLAQNYGTLIVLAIVIAAIVLLIVSLVHDRKTGKSSCSCGGSCAGCVMSGQCHAAHAPTPTDSDTEGEKKE